MKWIYLFLNYLLILDVEKTFKYNSCHEFNKKNFDTYIESILNSRKLNTSPLAVMESARSCLAPFLAKIR